MQFAGVKDAKGEELRGGVFALNCKEAEEVNIAIFVPAMRFDLSNRMIVLDAAIMPARNNLAQQHARVIRDIMKTNKLLGVNVTLDELRLWKEVLGSMVERCREWEHKEGCEHFTGGKAMAPPLGTGTGEGIIRDCGLGVFLEGYHLDYMGNTWKHARKFCVRATMSPVFTSSLVNELPLPPVLSSLPTLSPIPSIPVRGRGKEQCADR